MSREMQYDAASRAVVNNLYGIWLDSLLRVWNGTAFVEFSTSPSAANCCILMGLLTGSSTLYVHNAPAGIDLTQSYTIIYIDAASPSFAGEVGVQEWTLDAAAALTAVGLPALTSPATAPTVAPVTIAANGLDAITIPALTAPATTFVGMVAQLWRRFFKKVTLDSNGLLKTYKDDDTTVVTTQNYTNGSQGDAS